MKKVKFWADNIKLPILLLICDFFYLQQEKNSHPFVLQSIAILLNKNHFFSPYPGNLLILLRRAPSLSGGSRTLVELINYPPAGWQPRGS